MRRISPPPPCPLDLLCTNLEVEALLYLGERAQQHVRAHHRKKHELRHSLPRSCPHVCLCVEVCGLQRWLMPSRYARSPLSTKAQSLQRKLKVIYPTTKSFLSCRPPDHLATRRGDAALTSFPTRTSSGGERAKKHPGLTYRFLSGTGPLCDGSEIVVLITPHTRTRFAGKPQQSHRSTETFVPRVRIRVRGGEGEWG